jgi:hypothetical protein
LKKYRYTAAYVADPADWGDCIVCVISRKSSRRKVRIAAKATAKQLGVTPVVLRAFHFKGLDSVGATHFYQIR